MAAPLCQMGGDGATQLLFTDAEPCPATLPRNRFTLPRKLCTKALAG